MTLTANKNDRKLLASVGEYRVLTVKQLSVLRQRSFQVIRRRMRDLAIEGLITTRLQGYGRGRGRPEDLIFLTAKGAALLEEEGSPSGHAAGATNKPENSFSLDHLLQVNWFQIHLLRIERAIPPLSVYYLSPNSQPSGGDRLFLSERIPEDHRPGKFVEFFPDGVFSITCQETGKKTLLFFLEVDMGTETLASMDRDVKDIRRKILNYQALFRSGVYKRYEQVFESKFNGFRLLFLVNGAARLISLCRLVREMSPSDFIWVADRGRMFSHGLAAKIWARGGRNDDPPQSILGPGLACELPVLDKR
jgi:hypothetical protein